MLDKRNFYINSKWEKPFKPNDFEVINPSNEEACAVISLGNKEDVNSAVKAAKESFPRWSRVEKKYKISLLEIDLEGNLINGDGTINETGYVIHGAIHKNRKDIHCVMHTHSRAGLAISCMKEGLKPLIQDSAIFYNRISYHEWEGMSTDSEECDRLSKSLGANKVMILRNHGLLTCGESISEAFMLMYYLDRACKTQIDAESTGEELIIPTNNIMEYAAGQYDDPQFKLGKHEWPALIRLLDDKKSIYKQ